MNFRKADILGIEVASLTMQEAVAEAEKFMDGTAPRLIATANAEMIMRATHDDELKNILNTADLVVPDGAGTVWASNYLGIEMPERVAGFDLVQNLFANAPAKNGVYFSSVLHREWRKKPKRKLRRIFRVFRLSACATAISSRRTNRPSLNR